MNIGGPFPPLSQTICLCHPQLQSFWAAACKINEKCHDGIKVDGHGMILTHILTVSTSFWRMCFVSQDPIEAVRQKCEEAEHCVHTRGRLEECESRVGSRSATEEDCTEELFDFLHARDHCVSGTVVSWQQLVNCVYDGICFLGFTPTIILIRQITKNMYISFKWHFTQVVCCTHLSGCSYFKTTKGSANKSTKWWKHKWNRIL